MKLIFMVLLFGNMAFFVAHWATGNKDTEKVQFPRVVGQPINGLQTLAEREAKNKIKAAPKKVPGAVGLSSSAASAGGSELCQLIGPFAELLHAEYLVERLTGLEVQAFVRNIEIADGINYWVYLKPEMSEKEALRRLYEIQAKSIESYIISSGELVNGISFGQYSGSKEAQDKIEKIKREGYQAEVKEIAKNHGEIWVEIKEKSEAKISKDAWSELLKEEKEIERRQNYCLGVAP
jgi:ribosomal protein S8